MEAEGAKEIAGNVSEMDDGGQQRWPADKDNGNTNARRALAARRPGTKNGRSKCETYFASAWPRSPHSPGRLQRLRRASRAAAACWSSLSLPVRDLVEDVCLVL